jgi:hypothetical protein
MTAAELATYCVPEDPASPPLVGDTFRHAQLSMSGDLMCHHINLHMEFLHSLLQSYDLGLHQLTPSRILHMAAFVTLCEAYVGIEPHINLWSYFFYTRL